MNTNNRFINDNFMPKPGRKAPAITPVELAQKIFAAALKCEEADASDDLYQCVSNLVYENTVVQRDNKFSLDFENLDIGPAANMTLAEIESGQMPLSGISEFGDKSVTHPAQVGFIQCPSGFTFLGVSAGGDWQYPTYACLYWDGKKLRMYIPIRGNAVNAVLGCLFGDEEESANIPKVKKYLQPGHSMSNVWMNMNGIPMLNKEIVINDYLAQFGILPNNPNEPAENIPLNMDGILEDICNRIKVI